MAVKEIGENCNSRETPWYEGLDQKQRDKVREIAFDTQVPPKAFLSCPHCDESLFDDFKILKSEVTHVEYHCHNCYKLGDIDAEDYTEGDE